ncbi:hypothetical protein CMUS01_11036 [Colletotrichum musicola]|uniref:Uncharacterized protein n=1 Tax=Colletotrichum musicola TaxID=2175873 RepID=A0A8H6K165_9PEZI|nr:hypothetical protein CMUS01_11036 [Colletotrichum musicola]
MNRAMADTHPSCSCKSSDASCTTRACNGYVANQKWFNVPANAIGQPGATIRNGKCNALYENGKQLVSFDGFGGNEFKTECLKACNVGSSCAS